MEVAAAFGPELYGMVLLVVLVVAPFAVVLGGVSGRFWGAVRRRPERALAFFEGDPAWVVLRDAEAGDDLGDAYDGPYLLELPDGTDRVVYGRKDAMKPSMHRYLRRIP